MNSNYVVLIAIAIAIAGWYLYTTYEGMSAGPWTSPEGGVSGWDGLYPPAPYHNLSISGPKPVGDPGSQGVYNNWKHREEYWHTEYAPEQVDVDMDLVVGVTDSSLRPQSLGDDVRKNPYVNPKYFHNPTGHCATGASTYPCPNYWIIQRDPSAKHFKGTDPKFTHPSGDLSDPVPAMPNGIPKALQDSQINDNYHTRIVNVDREDHGLCDNRSKV